MQILFAMNKTWRDEIESVERRMLKTALELSNGNLSQASRALNISLPNARAKARRFKLWPWKDRKL